MLARQLSWGGAESGGVKKKLDGVHCETQRFQEFTVGLIKPMKSRTLKQQSVVI